MMKQIMRINILNMVKNASQLQVDHEVPVNVISAILRTSQCAIMSHVTSAPEIRKGVFFAFFFFKPPSDSSRVDISLQGAIWLAYRPHVPYLIQ